MRQKMTTNNMIKLIGALLIMFSGTAIGFVKASSFIQRSKQLRALIHVLQRLETEINYGQTPLPTAIKRSCEGAEITVSTLMTVIANDLEEQKELSLHEVWQQTIDTQWGMTALGNPEKEVLLRLGSVLGMSDIEDQLKHIALAQIQLKNEEEQARADQQRYVTMWRSLGTLGALLIVILMV